MLIWYGRHVRVGSCHNIVLRALDAVTWSLVRPVCRPAFWLELVGVGVGLKVATRSADLLELSYRGYR